MSIRLMGSATAANAAAIPASMPLIGEYVTGTPDIRWSDTDRARFPHAQFVAIDQGYTGSPVADATIRDVESGAWTPENACKLAGWTAARPTIYCDRNDLRAVLATGWQGDLALAIPESEPSLPPKVAGCAVVAVQFKFLPTWQQWVVFDAHWPDAPPDRLVRRYANGKHSLRQAISGQGVTVEYVARATAANATPDEVTAFCAYLGTGNWHSFVPLDVARAGANAAMPSGLVFYAPPVKS